MNTLTWQENQHQHCRQWRCENQQKPPRAIVAVNQCSADTVLKNAHARTATLWRGDYHQAKAVLAALKKRLRKPAKHATAPATPEQAAQAFHAHRMQQAQYSALANMLLVEISPGFRLDLARAPDVRAPLEAVYGESDQTPFLLPLNQLLGFIGAHEWHKTGVWIPALGARIHVPFGVFSPLRGEYLALVAAAPLPEPCHHAFDIGTGSGVLAAILAKRGVRAISATDTNPRALACARSNLERLGLAKSVQLLATDLFPVGRADLIVCNPPWLPAKPTSDIEAALYDPGSAMFTGFLAQATQHLNPTGEVWLIMSNLAELLGLRAPNQLLSHIERAGLQPIEIHTTPPQHAKAADPQNPLAFARQHEITSLYRLKAVV